MYIKCWGSRGSIPVSGKEYLKYGGDTTCIEVRAKSGDIVIIDAGTGIRRLGNQLMDEGKTHYHLLFTHAHWDHIMGFPYFNPLHLKQTKLQMHRCPFHSKFVESILSKVMAPPYFPVKYDDILAEMKYEEVCTTEFEIGSLKVTPIPLNHPNNGSGYKFVEDGKTFVFLTDNELGFVHPGGLTYKDYLAFASGADLLIHDAEYTPEEYKTYIEWGHSEYSSVIKLALEAGAKTLGLFHLHRERTDAQMDVIVDTCRRILKDQKSKMACVGITCDIEFEI
jgi:phosphoribosyl 1,2-cyclic phosphodiesterase